MARSLTTAHKNKLTAKAKCVGLLVEIDYTPTPVRVWTGHHDITWDSKTWVGLGALGGISVISEKIGVRAGFFKLTLNGVPSAAIANALDDAQQKRSVKVWVATFTASGGVFTIVADPNRMDWGETDVHEIIEGDDRHTIEVNVETPLARLQLLSVLRATHEDQQRHFPSDTAGRFAAQVAEKVLYWPDVEPSTANNTAAGGAGYKSAINQVL